MRNMGWKRRPLSAPMGKHVEDMGGTQHRPEWECEKAASGRNPGFESGLDGAAEDSPEQSRTNHTDRSGHPGKVKRLPRAPIQQKNKGEKAGDAEFHG